MDKKIYYKYETGTEKETYIEKSLLEVAKVDFSIITETVDGVEKKFFVIYEEHPLAEFSEKNKGE